jgi:predicted permease
MGSTLLHDFRYGARALRSAAGFTTVAVTTLALGIGANTAMFGVVDALLFKPPAGVASPRSVMKVRVTVPTGDGDGNTELSSVLSYPDYVDLRTRARGFATVAAYARNALSIGEGTDARTQPSLLVTGAYFPLLGVRPAIGRLIGPSDDLENAAIPVAVLSWDFWQRSYSADPRTLGQSIQINGQAYTIIGVAPEHFAGTDLDAPAVWVPMGTAPMLGYDARMMHSRFASWLSIVGRLGPSASLEQAQASAQAALLAARDAGEAPPMPGEGGMGAPGGEVRIEIGGPGPGGPGAPGGGPRRAPPPRQVRLTPLGGSGTSALPSPFGGAQPVPVSLWFLAVTGAVLLIACANVVNLLLARATRREHEIAVRLSLGAPAWRLTRQLMIESLLLAALGGVAGLILAFVGVAMLPRVVPLPPMPAFLDGRVLAFTAVLTLATTLAFGLLPAIRLARTDLQRVLSSTGRARAGRSFGKNALVVAQLAASLVLVIGAGLFIRSLRNVRAVDTGFAAEQVSFASLDGRQRFTREQAAEFWQRALERVRTLPGIRSASLGAVIPFEMNIMMPVDVPGYRSPDGRPTPAQIDFAGTEYFSTLGIPVKQGRAFTADDREGSAPVVIINETLARRAWGGASPIGKCVRIGMPGGGGPCMEVVGVAADARYADVTQPSPPFVYRPLAQRPRMGPPMTIMHIRTAGDPAAVAGLVRRELQALDPSVPFVRVVPMMDLIAPQLAPWRTGTFMFTLFGALGLALAAIGLYGVISFVVAQRTREMGVRIALGARRADVLALVLGQGGRLIAVGIVVGAAVAAASTRLFASMMYGVSPVDPVVYIGTAALLGIVGVIAMIVPARRATRVDPLVALRAD